MKIRLFKKKKKKRKVNCIEEAPLKKEGSPTIVRTTDLRSVCPFHNPEQPLSFLGMI